MSWYYDAGGAWRRRVPVTVYNDAAAGTYDATCVIPYTLDEFWDTVDASGAKVRVTSADGTTLVLYEWAAGFSTTTRSATLELDNVTLPGSAKTGVFWLYYDPDFAATDGSSVIAPASAKTGTIALEAPATGTLIGAIREIPGATAAGQKIHKTDEETAFIHWDISGLLLDRINVSAGERIYEEPSTLECYVLSAGAAQAGMQAQSSTRLICPAPGVYYVRQQCTGGTAATDYALQLKLTTDLGRVLDARAVLRVTDPGE